MDTPSVSMPGCANCSNRRSWGKDSRTGAPRGDILVFVHDLFETLRGDLDRMAIPSRRVLPDGPSALMRVV